MANKRQAQSKPFILLLLAVVFSVGGTLAYFATRGPSNVVLVKNSSVLLPELLQQIRTEGKSSMDSLVAALDDPENGMLKKALMKLWPDSVPSLMDGMVHSNERIALTCAQTVAEMLEHDGIGVPPEHVQRFSQILNDSLITTYSPLQYQYLRCVRHIGPNQILPMLPRLETMLASNNQLRREAIGALLAVGPAAHTPLVKSLASDDESLRQACAERIRYFATLVCPKSWRPETDSRERGYKLLNQLLPNIQSALLTDSPGIQKQYAWTMIECPELAARSFHALGQLVKQGDTEVLGYAMQAAALCTNDDLSPLIPRACEVLERLIKDRAPGAMNTSLRSPTREPQMTQWHLKTGALSIVFKVDQDLASKYRARFDALNNTVPKK